MADVGVGLGRRNASGGGGDTHSLRRFLADILGVHTNNTNVACLSSQTSITKTRLSPVQTNANKEAYLADLLDRLGSEFGVTQLTDLVFVEQEEFRGCCASASASASAVSATATAAQTRTAWFPPKVSQRKLSKAHELMVVIWQRKTQSALVTST
jgi:hypothetical protein